MINLTFPGFLLGLQNSLIQNYFESTSGQLSGLRDALKRFHFHRSGGS